MSVDHRKLGRELDLFDSDPLIGAGLPFWLPAGAAARHEVESYLYELERRDGYQHVYSPALGKREMYELSGHWRNFADDMFPPMELGRRRRARAAAQPVPAPRADLQGARSAPTASCRCGSPSWARCTGPSGPGVLGGLSRVRSMQLNDSHIFCALDQVGDEVAAVLRLMRRGARGARRAAVVVPAVAARRRPASTRATTRCWAGSSSCCGTPSTRPACDYREVPGEAAFYGPKIDVQVVDPAGRECDPVHHPDRLPPAGPVRPGLRGRGRRPARGR